MNGEIYELLLDALCRNDMYAALKLIAEIRSQLYSDTNRYGGSCYILANALAQASIACNSSNAELLQKGLESRTK